jgi:chromate reductase
MKILVISGSARTNNSSMRVALAMQRLLQAQHEVHIIDFVYYDIPLLAQGGLKMEQLTPFQHNLIHKMNDAQVVVIISPEYNWSTTPEILNMLHFLPDMHFDNLFNEKVFAFIGVSSGKGGKTPAVHLMQVMNKLISYGNHQSVVSAKIFESHYTRDVLDEEGNSKGNADYDKGLRAFCDYTIRVAQRWFK